MEVIPILHVLHPCTCRSMIIDALGAACWVFPLREFDSYIDADRPHTYPSQLCVLSVPCSMLHLLQNCDILEMNHTFVIHTRTDTYDECLHIMAAVYLGPRWYLWSVMADIFHDSLALQSFHQLQRWNQDEHCLLTSV